MSLADPQFSLAEQTDLFKINYYKKSENMYNSFNVLQGRIKKRNDFTGRQRFVSTPLSFSGGVGSGSLPTANGGNYQGAIIESKKVYATAQIDRESIKASSNNAGAFVQATRETVQKTVESYMRNCSRILFGDGSGILGRGDGATNVSGTGAAVTPYVVTLDASFHLENLEERDYVNIISTMAAAPDNSGGTDEGTLLEITAIDAATGAVSLVGSSVVLAALTGVGPLPALSGLAMQGSYENDPIGLAGIENATASIYGIAVQRRWSMFKQSAAGTGITVDKMNNVMLEVERKFGKVPNMIVVHYTQFKNILALLEDQKVYNLPNRNIKGNLSFQGVEFMSTRGPVGIFVDRFCPEDKIYFLNDSFIEVHHRPDFGWFDDDGTVFLRESAQDSYSARYGGYYENFITPTAHGVLTDLAK